MSLSHQFRLLPQVCMVTAFAGLPFFTVQASEQQQETLTVLGQQYRNTATKTSLAPDETPQAISVLSGESIEAKGATSLGQALRYAPGVVTETKGGSVTMYDNFYIRGFQVDQSYYDGLVLQYLKGWNLQPQIDPIMMQQVEVFKGPTSVLYGAMPPGGMVNIIAKKPQKEHQTQIKVSGGSRNLRQASIDTTGQWADSPVDYRMIALARKQDGQVDNTEKERYLIAPSMNWHLSEATHLNLNLYYQRDPNMGMNSSMPASGTVYHSVAGDTSPSTSVGDKNWSQFERNVFMAGYQFDHDFANDWHFLQNFRFMRASLSQKNTYHTASGFDAATGRLSRNVYSTDEDSKGYTVDNQLSLVRNWGQAEHNILFGLDYQHLSGESDYREYSGMSAAFAAFNLFNPNNNLLNTQDLTVAAEYDYQIKVKQLGGYWQDQMLWDNWVFITGLRWDHYQSSSEVSGYETEADSHAISYRVGALYQFDNGISPFVNYATSFSPVAGVDSKFGEPFEPEKGNQVELGVKYQSATGEFSGTLSGYRIIKSNVVVTDPSSANYQDDIQVGEVRSQGIETQANWKVTPLLQLDGSYTYSDVEVTKDSANGLKGTTPIYVPKHSATLWAQYQLNQLGLSGAQVGLGGRYVGSMYMNANNDQGKVPSYALLDMMARYELGELNSQWKGMSVEVSATNLTNKEYYSCYDNANCWYGAERNMRIQFGYDF